MKKKIEKISEFEIVHDCKFDRWGICRSNIVEAHRKYNIDFIKKEKEEVG